MKPVRSASLASNPSFVSVTSEQLVSQPQAVGRDDIGFAVVRDILDATLFKHVPDARAIHAFGLAGEGHGAREIVQRHARARIEAAESTSMRSTAESS